MGCHTLPGDLPNPGIEPESHSLTGGFFTTEPPESPALYTLYVYAYIYVCVCVYVCMYAEKKRVSYWMTHYTEMSSC